MNSIYEEHGGAAPSPARASAGAAAGGVAAQIAPLEAQMQQTLASEDNVTAQQAPANGIGGLKESLVVQGYDDDMPTTGRSRQGTFQAQRTGLLFGSSGMSESIYDTESHDSAQIMFSQAVARKRSFQPKDFDFDTKYCFAILAGVLPLLLLGLGKMGVLVLTLLAIISFAGYIVMFNWFLKSKYADSSLIARWANTNDPGNKLLSNNFLRKVMHNGVATWNVMITMLMMYSLFAVWFLGESFLCGGGPIEWLDEEHTTFKLQCAFLEYTRVYTPAQAKYFFETSGFANGRSHENGTSRPAWTNLWPELVAINEEHHETFDWVPAKGWPILDSNSMVGVQSYARNYYLYLQADMAAIVFIVVMMIQASSSFVIAGEKEERLGKVKDRLMLEGGELFQKWQKIETHCEVFARAKLYSSFNSAMISGSILGFGFCVMFLSYTPDWTFAYVVTLLFGAITVSCGFSFFRSNIAARAAYVTERLHLRAIFLSQMVGGSHADVKNSTEEVPVARWVELRDYLIGNVMQTEFGEISVVVAGIMAAAILLTGVFLVFVMPMHNMATELTLGKVIFGVFATIMWVLLLPLLLQVVAVNVELNLHTKLIGHKAARGDKECIPVLSNLQDFPTYLKLYGVPITPRIFNAIKGYAASAFLALAVKVATSVKSKTG